MQTNPPDDLEPRVEEAAQLLAAGKTQAEVAAALGVAAKTVQRWWAQPEVKARVRAIRKDLRSAYAGRLTSAARDAVEQLAALSKSGTRDDAVKLRASLGIIGLSLQGLALDDLQAEVDEISNRMGRIERGDSVAEPSAPEPPPDEPNDQPPTAPSDSEPGAAGSGPGDGEPV